MTHLKDDQHSELYGEREKFLRPPFFQHCVNSCEKAHDLPQATVGSNSEHEQFAHRD